MYPEFYGTSGFVNNAIQFFGKNDVNIINKFAIKKIVEKKEFFEIHSDQGVKLTTKYIISTLPPSLLSSMMGKIQNSKPLFVNYKLIFIEVEKKYVSDIYYVQDFDLKIQYTEVAIWVFIVTRYLKIIQLLLLQKYHIQSKI